MPVGVCTVLSFLSIVMASDMKSVGYDSSNQSVFVTRSPRPVLREGEVLIKVCIMCVCVCVGGTGLVGSLDPLP